MRIVTHRSSGSAWVIPALAATAAIVWGGWAATSALTDDAPGAVDATTSAADTLQQTLLRDNVRGAGDPALGSMYADINARFYQGTLPSMPVRWEARMADVGKLAGDRFTLQGMFGHIGGDRVILLNPTLRPDRLAIARALCHEIVHAYLASTGDESTNHGPAFQTELRRLAAAGAFEGMPATDEERTTLRSWLDTESARLDAERDEMERLGADLQRERAEVERAATAADVAERRDAYNQRAADANDRAGRDRADQDHFNSEVTRYNLMLVYPDGRDETDARRWRK